jgi:hypothetical protein
MKRDCECDFECKREQPPSSFDGVESQRRRASRATSDARTEKDWAWPGSGDGVSARASKFSGDCGIRGQNRARRWAGMRPG